jgi:hypothetical protein
MAITMEDVVVAVVAIIALVAAMVAPHPVMLDVATLMGQLSVQEDARTIMLHVQYMGDINGAHVSSIPVAIAIVHMVAAVVLNQEVVVRTQEEVHQCQLATMLMARPMVIKPTALRIRITLILSHPKRAMLQVHILLEVVIHRLTVCDPRFISWTKFSIYLLLTFRSHPFLTQ